jgi:type VI secretion system secreted protein VgrG
VYQMALDDGSSVQGATDSSGLSQHLQRPLMHQSSVTALRANTGETDEQS